MASIEKRLRKNGTTSYVVSFSFEGKRLKVSLDSDYSLSEAQTLANAMDVIVRARKLDEPIDRKTRQYLDNLPNDLATRLMKIGFVETKSSVSIIDALDEFLEYKFNSVAESTQANYKAFKKAFVPLVEVQKKLRDFNDRDVQRVETAWKEVYSEDTAASKMILLKTFLKHWEEQGVQSSLSRKIKACRSKIPKENEFQVPKEWSTKIFDACKDQEQRAMFALWRHGGLRKREPFYLTWRCVQWEKKRLIVISPKTKRYGKGSRTVPLFPFIERELLALKESQDEDELIFHTSIETSVERPLANAIKRAGYKPFARPFQNIRASFENDLIEEGFPAHVVAEWLGHTVSVQRKYYLRTLDSYYERALSYQ